MVASVKKRVCSNRECGKEFQPEYDVSIYCCRKCNDREKYLRRLDKKNGRVNGGENNVVPLHSDAVSPSSPTPQNEDILLRLTLAMEKQAEASDRQTAVLESLGEKLGNQDSVDDTLLMEILYEIKSIKLNGASADPKEPTPPAPTYDTKDELPVVEVKKSKASSNSSSNFLNSIMALNG